MNRTLKDLIRVLDDYDRQTLGMGCIDREKLKFRALRPKKPVVEQYEETRRNWLRRLYVIYDQNDRPFQENVPLFLK